MPTFIVHLMNGEPLRKQAHHYEIDNESGQIVFYKSETEVDKEMVLFKHGVISIKLQPPVTMTLPVTSGVSPEQP